MFYDTHGVPGYDVSGTNSTERFLMEAAPHGARLHAKFGAAEIPRHTLVKAGAAGVLEKVTAATDEVYGVLIEPKPAGTESFYVYVACTINRDLLNFTEMGITDDDIDQLQASTKTLLFARPIFSGAV